MKLDLIQSRSDRTIREKLLADSGVSRAVAKLEERRSGYGLFARRSLLTGALRLKRSMAPEVADALAVAREVSGYDGPVEMYVKSEPVFNAFCTRDPTGIVAIGLSSAMIEGFTKDELTFVIGHEIGHIAYDHFRIPMPLTAMIEDLAGRMVSRAAALELYVWCRAAELSADRLGLLCVRDPKVAASALFKASSGLSGSRVAHDWEAFSDQVDSIASAPSARAEVRDEDDSLDCFSTHPYNPLRVRALVAFAKSNTFRELAGLSGGGLSNDELEALVGRDLALMEPTYLEEKTAISELMRRLLFEGGLVVAAANGAIVPEEVKALRALLGADSVPETLDASTARVEVPKLCAQATKDVSLIERTRLVQHLTVIAAADGHVDEHELDTMGDIAAQLGVHGQVIRDTLRGWAQPMD